MPRKIYNQDSITDTLKAIEKSVSMAVRGNRNAAMKNLTGRLLTLHRMQGRGKITPRCFYTNRKKIKHALEALKN
jgi:hypothetical protein